MEWISVDDRLPENLKEVLVYEKWSDVPFVGYFNHRFNLWYANMEYIEVVGDAYTEDNITQKYVTHWQPLPPPPEEL